MDQHISISIENYDKNQQSRYEKLFPFDTTFQKVLQEFELDSAIIVNHENKIIEPEATIKKIYEENAQNVSEDKKLSLKLMNQQKNTLQQNTFTPYIKFKFYLKKSGQYQIIQDTQQSDNTLYSYFSEFQFNTIIHKNKIIVDFLLLQFGDIQTNKDDVVEFSILNESLTEDKILVIVYSDEIQQQVGFFNSNINLPSERYNEARVIKEKLLYYEVEKRSATIESILIKLNNQNIIAFQSDKGILDSKKTLEYYFKLDSQCKLLVIQNLLQTKNPQIENDKILVNIFQSGVLILREYFEKSDKIAQVENKLPKQLQGNINFIMPGKEQINLYDDLEDFYQKEITLEIYVRYQDYERMEAILSQTLKYVQEQKQKQKNIEITDQKPNPIYKEFIQNAQTINRLQQIIEEQKFKKDEQDMVLKFQTYLQQESSVVISNIS